jgi:hypothetical protein
MKVLTTDDAALVMNVGALDLWIEQCASDLQPAGAPQKLPKETKAQTGLAKLLAYLLLRDSGIYVYLSRWGQHPASEHLDLIYGYRRSVGESRSLSEAPVHFFDANAREQLVSILCLIFYFGWDAWIYDAGGKTLVRFSGSTGLEIRAEAASDMGAFAADPEKYFAPMAA